jgi:hypothetical protein
MLACRIGGNVLAAKLLCRPATAEQTSALQGLSRGLYPSGQSPPCTETLDRARKA